MCVCVCVCVYILRRVVSVKNVEKWTSCQSFFVVPGQTCVFYSRGKRIKLSINDSSVIAVIFERKKKTTFIFSVFLLAISGET